MIDLQFIGKNGLIVQYEDIISLIGFNVVDYFRLKSVNDDICKMTKEELLSEYINRDVENVSIWLKNRFGIDFDLSDWTESVHLFQPNLLYVFKLFKSAHENGLKTLIVHSEIYSPVIEEVTKSFGFNVEYTYGDIVPVIKRNVNSTFITSSTKNIMKCLNEDIPPIAITIVDDYLYLADILVNKIDDKLREKNFYVGFTGVISAGIA